MRKKIAIACLITVGVLTTFHVKQVSAVVIASQVTDGSVLATQPLYFQQFVGIFEGFVKLGSGYSLKPASVTFVAYVSDAVGAQDVRVTAYTDSTYSVMVNDCQLASPALSSGYQQITAVAVSSCLTMNPSYYYLLTWRGTADFVKQIRLYGSGNETYNYFYASSSSAFLYDSDTVHSKIDDTLRTPQFVLDTSSTTSVLLVSTTTRIVSITSPLDNSTSTQNVTFSGTYYFNTNYTDFNDDGLSPFIYFLITPHGQYNASSTQLVVPITTYNELASFSTTTLLENNQRYTWTASIYCPRTYDAFGCATPPSFPSVGFYQFTTGQFDPTFGQSFDLSGCNPLSFDGNDCFYNLIFPNNTVFPALMNQAKTAYAQAWPIGYITRLITIIASSTPVKPPFISIELPVGGTLELDPWDKLMGTSSLLSNAQAEFTINGNTVGDGRTFREITETYWIFLWYFILGMAIIRDLLGTKKPDQINPKTQ